MRMEVLDNSCITASLAQGGGAAGGLEAHISKFRGAVCVTRKIKGIRGWNREFMVTYETEACQ